MTAAYILLGIGVLYLIAASVRVLREGGRVQARTWFIIAGVFIAVGTWLATRG
jgi:hypothetical protein